MRVKCGRICLPSEMGGMRAHRLTRGWIGEECINCGSYRGGIARRQSPGRITRDNLARATHIASYHGCPRGQRLYPRIRKTFGRRRQRHHIRRRQPFRHIFARLRPHERYAVRDAKRRSLGQKPLAIWAAPDNHKLCIRNRRQRANHQIMPFARLQRPERDNQRCIWLADRRLFAVARSSSANRPRSTPV